MSNDDSKNSKPRNRQVVPVPSHHRPSTKDGYKPKPELGVYYRNDGHKHLKSFGTLT